MDEPAPDSTQDEESVPKWRHKPAPDSLLGGAIGIPVPPEKYSGMVTTLMEKPGRLEG